MSDIPRTLKTWVKQFLRAVAACYPQGQTTKMNEPTKLPDTESKPEQRRSFLLRLWCSNAQGASCWQASLEEPHTGERIGFADLEQLFMFLMEQVESNPRRDRDSPKPK